jgi:hypothetical protein
MSCCSFSALSASIATDDLLSAVNLNLTFVVRISRGATSLQA